MKLNLELELDYIDEEMNLDETIKQNIISTIVSRIENKIADKVKEAVEAKIDTTIVAKINDLTDRMFADFISRPVTISDGYGSKLKQYDNVEAIVKEKFDNFMTHTVDEKGKSYDGNYGTKFSRIEYIIDNRLKTFADKFTTEAVNQVSAEIKTHVTNGLTQKLGAELMKVLKLEKMLSLQK